MTTDPLEADRPLDVVGFGREVVAAAAFYGLLVVVVRAGYLALTEPHRYPIASSQDVWMPIATAVAIGLLATGLATLLWVFRRQDRPDVVASPAMHVVGVLGSLAFGGLIGMGVGSGAAAAVTSVADHTPAANAARAHVKAFETTYRQSPPVITVPAHEAPAGVAERMVTAPQLGAAWHPLSTDVRSLTPAPDLAAQGVTAEYETSMAVEHYVPGGWRIDRQVTEQSIVVSAAAQPRAVEQAVLGPPAPQVARSARLMVGGVPVAMRIPGPAGVSLGYQAAFGAGHRLWLVRYTDHAQSRSGAADLRQIVRLAIRQAGLGR